MRKLRIILVSTLLLFYSASFALRASALKPAGLVNDYTNTLSEQEASSLESLASDIEKETAAEIGVAVIRSLEGRNIEEYANEIFNNWGIGKKDKDNGVLILVSINDRQMRIETGYGIEPVLPDAACGRIIRNVMAPRFRENDFYGGIYGAVTAIGQRIKGEVPVDTAGNEPGNRQILFFLLIWNGFLALFSFSLFHTLGVIIYAAVMVPLAIIVILSGKEVQPAAAMGLLIFFPFLLVFFTGMLSPVIFALLRWKLKKKYGENWKKHLPKYVSKAMSRHSSTRSGRSGGSFGGGRSGGGGASGRW